MSSTFASLEQQSDRARADETVLSENKVADLVEYSRGNIVRNEEQFVLMILGKTTGFMRPFDTNVNSVAIGSSSGGKSHMQHAAADIFPSELNYEVSDSSNLAIVDDDEWDETIVSFLDEFQKIPEKMVEIIKSVSGEDIKYTYARNVQDDDSESGRTTTKMHKYAKPYSFLYAQFQMDLELYNRLLKLYVDDDERIHKAIGKSQAGHDHIEVEGFDKEYIYNTTDLEVSLRQHFRSLPTVTENLSGKDRLLGGMDAEMPPWVWHSAETIFHHARTETNRIYGMVFNLIRASAVLNYDNREQIGEYETNDGSVIPVYRVEPQDVANVLSARETLLGTTHELEKRKREIVEGVRTYSGLGDDGGCTIDKIQEYLDESNMATPKKDELRDILTELDDNYIINIRERAGPNGAHLYEFRSMKHIDVPKVSNLTEVMPDDEIEDCEAMCPNLDLDDPFADARDPFRDQLFKETVEDLRTEFSDDAVERANRVAEMGSESDGDEQQSLMDDAMGVEGSPDLNPVETEVHDRLLTHTDGESFSGEADIPHILGYVDDEERVVDMSVSGTMFDPNHDVWDWDAKPEDWVGSRGDAEARIEEAYDSLEAKGLIDYETTGDGIVLNIADV